MQKLILGVAIAGALVLAAQQTQRADVQLQSAINREVVAGDLKGAIEGYKKVAQSGNPALAAEALMRMGGAYDKLHDPEAKKVYARVVAEFANQPQVAARARVLLGAQTAVTGTAATEVDEVVWADIKGRNACAPPPDGSFVVCVGVEGNLWRHNLTAGEDRALTSDGSMPDNRGSAAFTAGSLGSGYSGASSPQVSSDNKFVAYRWDTDLVRARSLPSLRIVATDGSGQRILLKGDVRPFAWSPDDSRILVGTGQNGLGLVSVADGSMTVITTDASWGATPNAFSPDGSQIVFGKGEIHADPKSGLNRGTSSVWVMNAGGGGATQLIGDPNGVWNDGTAMWAPDGRSIVFISNRSGTRAVWSLAMANGKPQGEPVLLVQGALSILRLTQDGSIFHTTGISQTDVYTAATDPSSLKITSTPQRLNQRHIGAISPSGLDWSPDGRSLVYTSALGKSFIVNSLDRNEETEVKIPDGAVPSPPRFFPDGQALLAVGAEPGKVLFRRVDIRTGGVSTFSQIPADPLGNIPAAAVSPDGKSLFYSAPGGKVIRRELQTGEEKVVYQGYAGYFGIYVSPDGRQVALRPDLVVAPSDGGPVRELVHVGGLGTAWAKDGKHLLFLKGGNPTVVYAVPTDGTEPQPVGLSMDAIRGIAMNPENTRVAFLGTQSRSDLRAYRHLLPPVGPAQR